MLWSFNSEIAEPSAWHDHGMFQLVLCRGDKGRMLTHGQAVAFATARTLLIPPGTLHRFVVEPGEIGRLKIVCFPPKDLPQFLSPLHIAMLDGLARAGVSVADHDGQERWLHHLGDAILDGFGNDDVLAQRMQWGIVGLLLTLHARAQHVTTGHPYLRHKTEIMAILSWIESNLTEEITLEQVSNRFGISRSLLTREFRGHTGKSLVEY